MVVFHTRFRCDARVGLDVSIAIESEFAGGHDADVCSQGLGREYKFKPSDITGGCLALT